MSHTSASCHTFALTVDVEPAFENITSHTGSHKNESDINFMSHMCSRH